MHEHVVVVVGVGASGHSAAASLHHLSIPFIVLKSEDCYASLRKKYSYDRLHLHLPKQFCELQHASFPASYPHYVPKLMFLFDYLDSYVKRFTIESFYRRLVESAKLNSECSWVVRARNLEGNEVEYRCRFFMEAIGETSYMHVAEIEGIRDFAGKTIHTTEFKNGMEFKDMNVLVVGSGNSGMEIAQYLANHGAKCSVVFRSPGDDACGIADAKLPCTVIHHRHLPSWIVYGDLTKFGIRQPAKDPFDAIVFCTGFKRLTNIWLKGDEYLLNEDGKPKLGGPNHWRGKNGLYCVGLSGRGLIGAAADALLVADHINSLL